MRNNLVWRKAAWAMVACAIALSCRQPRADLTAHDYSVELIASVVETPPAITLSWLADANAQNYQISRKILGENSWSPMATVPGSATSWKDSSVTLGVAYEYQVIKPTGGGYTGYGYICSGIRRTAVEDRGKVILLVEKDLGAALSFELSRLQQDLLGDGWAVIRHDVAKTDQVTAVKQLIKSDYLTDPNETKALFLFGHIPVPYSGNIAPDEHLDHQGAWPADVYYGEFDGTWTDFSVNNTNNYTINPNVPGDGKFDQDSPPGVVRLQIGRVDLSNLTCFANKNPSRSEIDLARQYLAKDHNFRFGLFDVPRRGMIFDRMYRGLEIEPQTCAGWRSFPAFFGRDQITVPGQDQYFSILADNPYLWSYVVSGGSLVGCDYIGPSDAWALNEPKVVFTSFLGSYFGDWNHESDFLRAPLGTSGYTLACIFSGQPQWILHPMGLGEPIGESAMLTQNNPPGDLYPPQGNAGAGQVHIDLMGDPTLRMHVAKPPSNLTGNVGANGVTLTWTGPADRSLLGYYVYKSDLAAGPFARISGNAAITVATYNDPAGTSGSFYMVRTLRLEVNPSGSYNNLSQGIFYPDPLASSGVPSAPGNLSVASVEIGAANLEWIASAGNFKGYEVQRRALPYGTFAKIGEAPATSSTFQDTTLSAGTYAYRVKALGFAGDSDYSGEATLNLRPSAGAIVGIDSSTSGNWIGNYGSDGYNIIAFGQKYPAYATVATSNAVAYVSGIDTSKDQEVLQTPDGKSRRLAFWINGHNLPMRLSFRFTDDLVHRVTLYMVDYQYGKRSGFMDIIDPFTGRTNSSTYYQDFLMGKYFTLDLRNYADVVLSPAHPDVDVTVMISGIFFSTPNLQTPSITPSNGSFAGKTTVAMTADPGATIRYTTDGSPPGPAALTFTGPFVLTTNAILTAQAVRDGYPSSAIAQVTLTNNLRTGLAFIGIDTTTQGDWRNKYGGAGAAIAGWNSNLPSGVEWNIGNAASWTWSASTADPRAINKYGTDSGRVAAAWYCADALNCDLNVYSADFRPIALYFMDWDGGRTEDLTITDPSGAVLLQQRLENFGGGKYVVFNARGLLHLRIQRIAGANAALNGVFVGDPVVVSSAAPQLGSQVSVAGGSYTIHISGQPGQVFDIQRSADLRAWIAIGSKTLSGTAADFQLPIDTTPGPRFFRAILSQ